MPKESQETSWVKRRPGNQPRMSFRANLQKDGVPVAAPGGRFWGIPSALRRPSQG